MTKESAVKLPAGRTVRRAVKDDLPLVMRLIQQGRAKMIAAGNPHQWPPAYPPVENIAEDIARGGSYLLYEDDLPVATFAFLPGPDPTYSHIEGGSWLDNRPYHVIHRVASAEGVHGVMADIVSYCSAFTSSIRVDTHADNRPMQAALSRLGFVYCGVIRLENGDGRRAYQRICVQMEKSCCV